MKTESNDKAIRTTIDISGITVEVFKVASNGDDNDYVISQSQVAKAIEVHPFLMSRFLDEKQLQPNPGKDYRNHKIPTVNDSEGRGGNNRQIKAISINLASEFWATQAFKGNLTAQSLVYACVLESFKRRCDTAFSQVKTENEYQQQSAFSMDAYLQSREYVREAHHSFQLACRLNDWIAPKIHDYITLGLCGKKASELKEDELINGSPDIGLNHIGDAELLTNIAKVKMRFSKYLKGTPKERVKRAIQEVMGKHFKPLPESEQFN